MARRLRPCRIADMGRYVRDKEFFELQFTPGCGLRGIWPHPAGRAQDHPSLGESRQPTCIHPQVRPLTYRNLKHPATVAQTTGNLNLTYVFGHLIIDKGDEGYLTDLQNLFGNPWASFPIDDEDIETLFEIFKIFYTAER